TSANRRSSGASCIRWSACRRCSPPALRRWGRTTVPWSCCRPSSRAVPPPTATNSASCKVDAALAYAVTRITVREALPRMGILLHTPGVRAGGVRRTERGLRAQEQARPQQQGAGGLPGEEEASHARDNLQRDGQNAAKARAPACLQARPPTGFVLTGAPPGGTSTWPNSSAI